MKHYSYSNNGDREINEDSVGTVQVSDDILACIVADGLGGHSSGEVASSTAVTLFEEMVRDFDRNAVHAFWEGFFSTCETRLEEKQDASGSKSGMKTTVVAAVMMSAADKNEVTVYPVHVGDSRLYFFHKNKIKFRTYDHSVPQMLVYAKMIKENEIRNHPDRNRLTKVMGERDAELYFEEHSSFVARKGDAMLFCTDGFWELVEETDMCSLLKSSETVSEWIECMTNIVNKKECEGKKDNYSVIGVWF